MATEKRLNGIPNKCDSCVYITACQRACTIFNYPFYDFMIRSASCGAYEPKAETVEVVRCEKCRYYEKAEYDEGYKMVCRLLKRQTASNGFCYCGERKDNG